MRNLLIGFIFLLGCVSCQKDLDELEKYQPPSWLKGKLFTQIQSQEELTTFADALEITGMDSIINTSGLYTVFAPTNNAFDLYFESNPEYSNDINNIPTDILKGIINFHIVQNAWSKEQLVSVNLNGWIDEDEDEITTLAYKKETLYKDPNKDYNVTYVEDEGIKIQDESTGQKRKVYTRSRKYVPLFFSEYFKIYDLIPEDYKYLFNRDFEGGFYFVGAKVTNEVEIPAENGYVYIIDRIVEPLPTAEDILKQTDTDNSYQKFLNLIYEFPDFTANMDATYQQAGADQGLQVDTLYNLNYPELAFNIQSEITDPTNNRLIASIQYHNGLLAPTDEAFDAFISKYISGTNQWGSIKNLPRFIKNIIINSYMSSNIIYKSNIDEGFINAERDEIFLDENNIIERKFASNATFYGLQKAIVPRAFSSVTAPVYLRRGYYSYLTAIEETNILDALKKSNQDYYFLVIPDLALGVMADSSLIISENRNRVIFSGYDYSSEEEVSLAKNDIRKKILNHVGVSRPDGNADLEFIMNLAGNYIQVDNVNNIVTGSAPTSYGLNGDSMVSVHPTLLDEETDNGKTYEIDTWLSFSKNPLSAQIYNINPEFIYLMEEAGLAERIIGEEFEFTFLNPGVSYTVFVPSYSAMSNYNTDTLSNEELSHFIQNHFIQNRLIFTDGKIPSGLYPTTNTGSENLISIQTAPDIIEILDKNGNSITRIEPDNFNTNITTTTNIGNENSDSEWNFITNGVVHLIDTVLIKNNVLR